MWPSKWSSCSGNCRKHGAPEPIRSRSRTCHPAAFGGRDCSYLESQARRDGTTTYREEQKCTYLPKCPKPATMGPWGDWSACSQSCYPEGRPVPQQERKRSCIPEFRSTDPELNRNLVTCKELGEEKVYKNCNVGICPGDVPRKLKDQSLLILSLLLSETMIVCFSVAASWQPWGAWSSCTISCGEGGTRQRQRNFVPGRYGFEFICPVNGKQISWQVRGKC